jgi:hypothetical protein
LDERENYEEGKIGFSEAKSSRCSTRKEASDKSRFDVQTNFNTGVSRIDERTVSPTSPKSQGARMNLSKKKEEERSKAAIDPKTLSKFENYLR